MLSWIKLNPNERLLIESRVNQYKVVGPGWVWLTPRQHPLTTLYIGPSSQAFQFDEVRTVEEVPLKITVQVLYRIDPHLFTNDLLSKIPGLNDGGWSGILHWQTEYVLRLLVADYAWRDLGRQQVQERLERQLTQTLADRLKTIGLDIGSVCLVKTELPLNLQKTLIQAERDQIEAQGRAAVLKEYFDIFGDSLPRAMPYIIQWELLNTIHKNDHPQLLLTAAGLSLEPPLPEAGLPDAVYQMELPVSLAGQELSLEN